MCLIVSFISNFYTTLQKNICLFLGNVISDGQVAHDSSGIQNAHFGLTTDERIFIGYYLYYFLRNFIFPGKCLSLIQKFVIEKKKNHSK